MFPTRVSSVGFGGPNSQWQNKSASLRFAIWCHSFYSCDSEGSLHIHINTYIFCVYVCVYISNIPALNSSFCVTVLLCTAFFYRATGRIKSELCLLLTEMPFYPFNIVNHIGVNTRVVRWCTSITPWHNTCEEPFTLQRSTTVTLTEDVKISNLSSLYLLIQQSTLWHALCCGNV
jgi:hypothetical protein